MGGETFFSAPQKNLEGKKPAAQARSQTNIDTVS